MLTMKMPGADRRTPGTIWRVTRFLALRTAVAPRARFHAKPFLA